MLDLKALFTLNYGLYIVSSISKEGKINGLIANSVAQVTAEPVRVAVTLNKESLTHEFIEQTGLICVQPLTEKANLIFIGNFGFRTGRNYDKFAKIAYRLNEEGLPIVTENTASYLILRVNNKLDLDTHTMFICSLEEAEILETNCPPMTYEFYHQEMKGKTPKGAVTYQKEENKGGKKMKYICNVCGYVYDEEIGDPEHGIPAGTAWKDVKEDWVCPVCGVGKDQFSAEN